MLHLKRKIFWEEYWTVAYRRTEENEPMPRDGQVRSYELLRMPRGYWCSDPFLVQRGGETWLFCEMVRRYTRRGVLGCCRLDGEEKPILKPILQLPCHTSYPAVFRYAGQYYLIPETVSTHSVKIYRAVHFPYEWKHEKTLLQGIDAVDTTPLVENGKVTLFLYEPDDANGRYTLSAAELNMSMLCVENRRVLRVYDEKRGRGAGEIFHENGMRIRPSQDSRMLYGGRIEYMTVPPAFEIDSAEPYTEECVGTYSAESVHLPGRKRYTGLHTINRAGGFEAIDLFFKSFYPLRPIEALRFRLARYL